jgi:xanthine dehydrogenase accessory factor
MLYQNADQQVIGFVVDCLAARRTVWLCTVLSTFGSSPRPRGSLFAFDEQGAKAGSLSGGCVEEDLVERTLAQHGQVEGSLPGNQCEVIVFGATPEEAGRLRLPCGGLLRVAVERYGRNAHTQSGADADLLQFRDISRP